MTNHETRSAIEQLVRSTLNGARSCSEALCSLQELARLSAERAETLAAYLHGQVAVRARAFEQPAGQWWAACDDCGPLVVCTNEEQALRHALEHRWHTHGPVALAPDG